MKAGELQALGAVLAKIKARFDTRKSDGLICKQGFYNEWPVLKLQKASWTNDRMDQLRNKSGIFFSIWMDEEAASKRRVKYNIHALKLRQLEGYSIGSRDFAGEFRKCFVRTRDDWPNVRVDYGPLTLLQGWIAMNPKTFEDDAIDLLERFTRLAPMIDRLLDSRRK